MSLITRIIDEILLGLDGTPILCLQSSPPRIERILKKLGTKAANVIGLDFDQKTQFLGSKKFRSTVLAVVAGAGLLYLVSGGIGALASVGVSGIKLVLVDP